MLKSYSLYYFSNTVMNARIARTLLRSRPRPESESDEHLSAMDRRAEPLPRIRRRVLLAVGITLVAGMLGVGYVKLGLTRTLAVSRDQVVIAPVKSDVFTEYIPSEARIAPRKTAYLDAVEGGQVSEVLVEEGALVERGQVLVRLNNTNLQLEVLGRQAQLMEQLDRLASTTLSFEQARLGHERDLIDATAQIRQLSQRLARREASGGAVPAAEIEETRIDLERFRNLEIKMTEARDVDRKFQTQQMAQLRDAVKTTQQNLARAGETLQNLAVRAPIRGQLSALDADLGAAKAPGQRMGQIDDSTAYKAEASIDEFYLGRVAVGQLATAEVDGHPQRLEVAKVYSQVRDRQFKVDLVFTGSAPQSLRRGQTLQVRLEVGAAHKSLVTANGPFYEDTGGTWVFVLARSGREAERRNVRLGRRTPEQVEVLAGLSAGERIITSSYEQLRAFDRIRIRGDLH
ncbi:MAG: efflux RND transporter periplasmic adaptor subunit [Steroidobacteraceae bacterium]